MKRFAPGLRMTAFYICLFPALIALGFWQVSRGAEKRAMEEDYLQQITALPVAAIDWSPEQRFQRIRLHGQFTDKIFLLDNQVLNGVTGYWIVQVFNDINGRSYLANRGFLPGAQTRDELPRIESPMGELKVVGVVWPFTGLLPVLDDDVWSAGWPKRIQRFDVARMAALVGAQPFEVRLESGQPGVEVAAPFAQVLSDAKHLGYAATWFGLAVVLSIGFIVFGLKEV